MNTIHYESVSVTWAILAAFDQEQDSLNLLNFLSKRHPNIKFTIGKTNHSFHRFT